MAAKKGRKPHNAITHDAYASELADTHEGWEVVEPYRGRDTKIMHRCPRGHESLQWPGNLLRKAYCAHCAGNGEEGYKVWLKEHRPGVRVIGEYKTTQKRVMHLCENGHEWYVKPNNVKSGKSCKVCSGNFKQTPEVYRQWLLENRPDITAVEDYVCSHTGIKHLCSEGHVWSATPTNIKGGTQCPRCSGHIPQDYDEWLAENCPDIKALEPYVSTHEKIMHEHECGHTWSAQPANIKSGRGCPKCSDGSDFDAIYLWEWVEDGKGTGIFKLGVTSWRLGTRRIEQCARDNGIDYRLIGLCQTSEGDALHFEKALLDMGDEVALPDHIVDGRTEFRIYNDEELDLIKTLMGVKEEAIAEAA